MTEFKVGDKVRWKKKLNFGIGVVVALGEKGGLAVRFDGFDNYSGEEDYHVMLPSDLEPVRTLAEKRQDDFEVLEKASEPWRNPEHYQFPGGVQVIDITRHLSFPLGNVIKYCSRAGKKGPKVEDLQKALKYLEWAIEDAKKESE